MRIEQSLKVKDRMARQVVDAFVMAKSCSMTHDKLLEQFQKINESQPKGTPQWVYWYLRGVKDCLYANLYRNDLEFCYVIDGKIYSTHKDSFLYYENCGLSPKELNDKAEEHGHFWKRSYKPFSVKKN